MQDSQKFKISGVVQIPAERYRYRWSRGGWAQIEIENRQMVLSISCLWYTFEDYGIFHYCFHFRVQKSNPFQRIQALDSYHILIISFCVSVSRNANMKNTCQRFSVLSVHSSYIVPAHVYGEKNQRFVFPLIFSRVSSWASLKKSRKQKARCLSCVLFTNRLSVKSQTCVISINCRWREHRRTRRQPTILDC